MDPATVLNNQEHAASWAPRVRRARTRPVPTLSNTKICSADDDSIDEPVYDVDSDDDDDDAHEREWNAYLASSSVANTPQTLNYRDTSARTHQPPLQNSIERIAAAERLHLDRHAVVKSRAQASPAPTQRFDALLFGHATQSFTTNEEDDDYHNELQARVYDREVYNYARYALRAIRANPTEHSAIRVAVSSAFHRARNCARQACGGDEHKQLQDTQAPPTSISTVGQIGDVPPPPYRRIDALATDVQQLTEIYARGRPELAEWVHRCQQQDVVQEKGEILPRYSEVDPLATLPRYRS
jgi:hypothetical protein